MGKSRWIITKLHYYLPTPPAPLSPRYCFIFIVYRLYFADKGVRQYDLTDFFMKLVWSNKVLITIVSSNYSPLRPRVLFPLSKYHSLKPEDNEGSEVY